MLVHTEQPLHRKNRKPSAGKINYIFKQISLVFGGFGDNRWFFLLNGFSACTHEVLLVTLGATKMVYNTTTHSRSIVFVW